MNDIFYEKMRKRNYFSKENNFLINKNVNTKLKYEMKINDPIITIIVPTYKRFDLLKECVGSLLNQRTSYSYQVLIIDNDSDNYDAEIEFISYIKTIAEPKNIQYFCNEKNLGAKGNWNRGIELANTEWVMLVHDDDLLNENCLELMMNNLKKKENIDILIQSLAIIYEYADFTSGSNFIKKKAEQPNKINSLRKVEIRDYLYSFNYPLLGAIIKRNFILELGGFVSVGTKFEDYIFMVKSAYYGNVFYSSLNLYGYRILDNDSLSKSVAEEILILEHFFREQIFNKTNEFRLRFKIKNNLITLKSLYFNNSKILGYSKIDIDEKYVLEKCEISSMQFFSLKYFVKIYIKLREVLKLIKIRRKRLL